MSRSMSFKIAFVTFLLFLKVIVPDGPSFAKSLYAIGSINSYPTPVLSYDIQGNSLVYQTTNNIPYFGWGAVGITVDSDSSILFVTYEMSNTIQLIDAKTMTNIGVTIAPSARDLAGIVVDQGNSKVYTVDRSTNRLYVYNWDVSTYALTLVGGAPLSLPNLSGGFGIALDEVKDVLYIADYTSNKVVAYNTNTWAPIDQFTVSHRPIGIAVDVQNNLVYTGSGWAGGTLLSKFDLTTRSETCASLSPAGAMGIAVDQTTALIYITTGYSGDNLRVFDRNLVQQWSSSRIGDATGLCVPGKQVSYNPLNLAKNGLLVEEGAYIGGSFAYRITCRNPNSYDAENVVILDTLPNELDFVSATKDGLQSGNYDPAFRTVSWNVGTIPAGGNGPLIELTVTVNQNALPGSTVYNTCTIQGSGIPPTTVIDQDPNDPSDEPGIPVKHGKQQVLFIHGIMASKLWERDVHFGLDIQRWPALRDAEVERLAITGNGTSENDIYVKEGKAGIIDEYMQVNVYKKFIKKIEDDINHEWTIFNYDWRLKFDQHAMKIDGYGDVLFETYETLKSKVQELASKDADGRVDIVAHSMGGLLAKYYVTRCHNDDTNCSDQVGKLLLVACPQLGTPAGAAVMTHGEHSLTSWKPLNHEVMRSVAQEMPSVFTLMPAEDYFEYFGGELKKDMSLFYIQKDNKMSCPEIEEFKNRFSVDGIRTWEKWQEFHNIPNIFGTNDSEDFNHPLKPSDRRKELFKDYAKPLFDELGTSWDPFSYGMERTYQIVGSKLKTLTGIEYYTALTCEMFLPELGCLSWKPYLSYRPKKATVGDGTVVEESAKPLLEKGVKTYYVDVESYNKEWLHSRVNRDHSSILEIEGVQEQVKALLDGNEEEVDFNYISLEKPQATLPWIIIIVKSPVEIHLYDSVGNHTGPTPNGNIEQNVPNSQYGVYDKVHPHKYVLVPLDFDDLVIEFQGTDSGTFSVAFEKYNESDSLVATKHFVNMPVTNAYRGRVLFRSFEDISEIQNDVDGDGIYEGMAPQTHLVNVNGGGVYNYLNTKATFNTNIKANLEIGVHTGHVNFVSNGSNGKIVSLSSDISKVNIDTETSNTINIDGSCRVNNKAGYRFKASIFDGGIPGKDRDMVGIEITGPDGFYYNSFGRLTGGDYKVNLN